jgi:Poly(ADP-ribose) polymerase catalytic domain
LKRLEQDVVPEVNEYVLLHGTKQEFVDIITNQGLDSRISCSDYFGAGVYFAESSTKADQYAGK